MDRPVAVICALDWELAHLRKLMPAALPQDWQDGPAAYVTELDGQSIVLTACGMGMVGAAAGTQHVVSRYAPRAIVNYGCAGAHRAELLPGDIVVATHLVAYEHIREMPNGELHYRGMYYVESGEQRRVDALAVDQALLAAAQAAATAIADGHEPWPQQLGWPADVPHRSPRITFGTVVSADRWNRAPATLAGLVARHDSLCEDMEAAAIGLVCASRGVPFISIKDISNNELLRPTLGGQSMLSELGLEQIARRAAAFTLAVVRAYVRAQSSGPGAPDIES
jgi:adenosylhomocysteine nucleosidase